MASKSRRAARFLENSRLELLPERPNPYSGLQIPLQPGGQNRPQQKLAALTLTSWNQLVADLTSIRAVMEHIEEKPSGQLVLAAS